MTTTHRASQQTNGVDVEKLLSTIQSVKEQPELADFEFRVRNRWLGGDHNRSVIHDFHGAGQEDTSRAPYEFDNGEPEVLCGTNAGANPVEFLLHALAGCMTTTMAFHCAARGIEIESISSELRGDIDVQGFLGLRDDVPKGYSQIRAVLKVKSDAPAEQLEELAKMSPVYNTLKGGTDLQVRVEKVS